MEERISELEQQAAEAQGRKDSVAITTSEAKKQLQVGGAVRVVPGHVKFCSIPRGGPAPLTGQGAAARGRG